MTELVPLQPLSFSLKSIGDQRYYAFDDGGPLPSVTTILSATKNMAGLEAWRKKVGPEEADRIRDEAAERGKNIHSQIEDVLTGKRSPEVLPTDSGFYQGWHRWAVKAKPKPLLIEGGLWAEDGYAGTTDALCLIDGEPVINDWKTSVKRKQERYAGEWKLQTSAYAHAVEERYGIPVKKACIVVCMESGEYQDFWVDTELHYEAFTERLRSWYWDV